MPPDQTAAFVIRILFLPSWWCLAQLDNTSKPTQMTVKTNRNSDNVASRNHLRSVCLNELMVPRHKPSSTGRRAFSVAAPSLWNSLANYPRDSFWRQLYVLVSLTLLGATHRARYRDIMTMRCINLLITYLFNFLRTKSGHLGPI